jgi:hypothetical protein
MASDSTPASPQGGVRKMSAGEFQKLLREPLGRLGIATPDLETCEELVIWTGHGPMGNIERTRDISDKPHRYMTALAGSLDEVESFWTKVTQHAVARAPNEQEAELAINGMQATVFEPLARLRKAMDECAPLVAERPKDFVEGWDLSAKGLATVFRWVVARSGSNVRSGLSPNGPAIKFIMDGLSILGWRRGNQPTEDAVIKYLRRNPPPNEDN